MLRKGDLDLFPGLTSGVPEAVAAAAAADHFRPPPLVPGSTIAQALHSVWSGQPITIVRSPPGSGKTKLVAEVIAHLRRHTDLTIGVGAISHAATAGLAGRIAELTGPDVVFKKCKALSDPLPPMVEHMHPDRVAAESVDARVIAAWKQSREAIDLLVVDEAYQLTASDMVAAGSTASQMLLVGDPGQIGPVVATDTSIWHGWNAPHLRAPDVLAGREDAHMLALPSSFRLGRDTVAILAPLYSFPFGSGRPDRRVGSHAEIESVLVTAAGDAMGMAMAERLAELAAGFVGEQLHGDGAGTIGQEHVAVVVARNAQVSIVGALLREAGLERVTVGTADKLQGGQWHAVVALDPLAGSLAISSHSASLGRLCVMASRHSAHLTWVHDGQWERTIREGIADGTEGLHLQVRRGLTA